MEQLSREQRINILQRLYEVWADQNNQVIDEISITEKKEIEEEVDDAVRDDRRLPANPCGDYEQRGNGAGSTRGREMTEQERYFILVRMLRQKKKIRVYSHMSMYDDGWIKIYEVVGIGQATRLGKCLVAVSDDDEDALYRRAANDIRMILIWEKEKDEKEK